MGIGIKTGTSGQINNNIQTDGLVYYIDAAYKKSYPQLSSDAFNLASGSLTPTASLYNDTSGSFDAGPKAWNFDGVDAYMSFPQSSGQFSGDPMSFEWVWKKDDTSDGVILMDRPYYHNAYGIEIWVNTKVNVRGSGATILVGTQTTSIDTWYHTIVTFNSTTANIYINGVLDKSGTVNALADSTYNFNIGRYPTIAGTYNWDGELAFLRIYDYTLTAGDVLQNYNASKDRFGL